MKTSLRHFSEKLFRACTQCRQIKPFSEFYSKSHWPKNYQGASAYYSECKECFRARMRKARAGRGDCGSGTGGQAVGWPDGRAAP